MRTSITITVPAIEALPTATIDPVAAATAHHHR